MSHFQAIAKRLKTCVFVPSCPFELCNTNDEMSIVKKYLKRDEGYRQEMVEIISLILAQFRKNAYLCQQKYKRHILTYPNV